MAGPIQSILDRDKCEDEELACTAGVEAKKTPTLPGGAPTRTMRTRQFLLPVREYGLANCSAMRGVTVGCDVKLVGWRAGGRRTHIAGRAKVRVSPVKWGAQPFG
jgi:hypothetical protein